MAVSTGSVSAATEAADRELVFTRVYDAPRELVFEAWTDPKHVTQWWGPKGFTTTIHEMDVRPGGVWRLVMHGPDGKDYNNRIVFLEVVKPERLVYKHDPEKGSEPVSFQVTVTFAEEGAKTWLTMQMVFPSAASREYVVNTYGAIEGANQTLGRLAEHLPQMAADTVKSGYAPVNGLNMYYEIRGAGRPLVLLYGGGSTIDTSFGGVLDDFAKTRQVIAFDQQGHGRTADVDRPFNFEQSADDTEALLRYLGVERADFYGYSNGGSIALQVAIRHPGLARKIVAAAVMINHDGANPEFWESMKQGEAREDARRIARGLPQSCAASGTIANLPRQECETNAGVQGLAARGNSVDPGAYDGPDWRCRYRPP
jgi:uncharacterized protein YndB with AHSA1/START domain